MGKDSEPSKVGRADGIATITHGGHKIRTGRRIIDRSQIGKAVTGSPAEKRPNQYNGHTYKNNTERFRLDGHKLLYHLDRILRWQKGERIAPIQIDMGLTKFCNVGCIYCIGVTQGGMKKGMMIDPGALLRFIEDCGKLEVRSIAFIGDGEPTLNPGLYDAIALAGKLGIDTGMATNGILLEMNHAHDVLRDSTFIRFNLSAADPAGFARIHQSARSNFPILLEKIKALVDIRNRNKYACTIGIQMVLIPENFDQVVRLSGLGAELGADYLQIKQCSDTEYQELGINPEDYKQVTDALREAEKQSSEKYLVKVKWNKIDIMGESDIYKGGFRKYDICYGTPFLGQISGNGKIYPCGPFFEKERFYIGNIHEESYYDIIKGDRYWEVQQDIIDHVDVHYDCTVGCRQDYINKFLWDLKNPPDHINFI